MGGFEVCSSPKTWFIASNKVSDKGIVSSVFLDTQSEHKSKIIHPFQESEIGTILLVAQEPMMLWTNGEYRSIQHIK